MITLILAVAIAHADLSWEAAINKCKAQTHWGYFRQKSFKGNERVTVWSRENLYGKYKSKEECDVSRKQYKKGWAEVCEAFAAGDAVSGEVFRLELVIVADGSGERESTDLFFTTKEKCEKARANGGTVRRGTEDLNYGGMAATKSHAFVAGECQSRTLEACKRNEPPSLYTDID